MSNVLDHQKPISSSVPLSLTLLTRRWTVLPRHWLQWIRSVVCFVGTQGHFIPEKRGRDGWPTQARIWLEWGMFTRHRLSPTKELDCAHAMGTNAFSPQRAESFRSAATIAVGCLPRTQADESSNQL